eukprot:gnl/Dysnectes_brevis/3586_a4561_450.p1 GENE.gnl/Dysnectes_brevis/3586_a4561_450~~gnl/Dysnectes_brevis/3586_a4561_450.p1  ORF type:complete len:574 (-),score=160.89 gnl/Dysnectes_brevis/3586_a4561_450:34-1755(-)
MTSKTSNQSLLVATHEVGRKLIEHFEKTGVVPNRPQIIKIRSKISSKYHLDTMPKFNDILHSLPHSYKEAFGPALLRKPVRTASGVSIVAVMCKPHRCPHQATTGRNCLYCAGGPDSDFEYSSQSYTGFEPTSMRAIRARYDPGAQVRARVAQISRLGHPVSKVEFILMGGTFMSLPKRYQTRFILGMFDGLTGHSSADLPDAIRFAALSNRKCVGLTIETRPDFCHPSHLTSMLRYGATRLEIGVQTVYDSVMVDINRGHGVRSVERCFGQSRDAGFKLTAHMMPNLPRVSLARDLWGFRELFESCRLRPDGLKLYPTLVMRGTGLYERWRKKRFRSYPTPVLVELLSKVLAMCPPWVRVYRVMRDIPLPLVTDGADTSNLREMALASLARLGRSSLEIRQREAGLVGIQDKERKRKGGKSHRRVSLGLPELRRRDYWAGGGWETFLSYERPMAKPHAPELIGLLRLRRLPRGRGRGLDLRPELRGSVSLVRELHVYGQAAGVADRRGGKAQHRGFGRALVLEAERISRSEHRSAKLAIIAGVGTREYYGTLGYELDGPYMSKMLMTQQPSQ